MNRGRLTNDSIEQLVRARDAMMAERRAMTERIEELDLRIEQERERLPAPEFLFCCVHHDQMTEVRRYPVRGHPKDYWVVRSCDYEVRHGQQWRQPDHPAEKLESDFFGSVLGTLDEPPRQMHVRRFYEGRQYHDNASRYFYLEPEADWPAFPKRHRVELDGFVDRLDPKHRQTIAALQYFGLESMPTRAQLEAEIRRRSLRLHPDRGGDSHEFKRMQEMAEALRHSLKLERSAR